MNSRPGRWLDFLVDPVDRRTLSFDGRSLIAGNGIRYPIIEGIPVLLRADVAPTLHGALRTLKLADRARQGEAIDFLAALNRPNSVKEQIRREIAAGSDAAEAVIRRLVRATNGYGYRDLSATDKPPIPQFPQRGTGEHLLDVGCSWGRWTIAAARAGFRPIGIDPQLGPLLAAKRFASQNGIEIDYICGDARHLPFKSGAFERAFSYSTLQHFSDDDCKEALAEIARVLSEGGRSTIQMANSAGIRSLWHQARRGFRVPAEFEVRYRSLPRLLAWFTDAIGATTVSIDCFFGLGLQSSDIQYMRPLPRIATRTSEQLKRFDQSLPLLHRFADSLYFNSTLRSA
jgi:2-polyprenyl-3-methyl-5-hydroxy-6-metoxy-1,4-benzoquinol methylase/uncharacterized protein YbaR (Trm112 family)